MTLDFWRESGEQLVTRSAGLPPAAIYVIRAGALSLNLLNAYWFSQARPASLAVKLVVRRAVACFPVVA